MKKLVIFLTFLGIVALFFVWALSFMSFVQSIVLIEETSAQTQSIKTDAIVVLTGGSERVETGMKLLTSGSGKKLLISGVHKKLGLNHIPGLTDYPEDLGQCCILLGYEADSTEGNAKETRNWIAAEGYTSLRLVTSNYHMPRSLLLFQDSMPKITIVPHPVSPQTLRIQNLSHRPGTFSFLAVEHLKYLVVKMKLRLTGLWHKTL